MRSGSSLKSVEKYDEHRQNSKKVPKATRKNKNHSSKNTLTQSISTLHKRAKKKSSSNAFARGKNQQNYSITLQRETCRRNIHQFHLLLRFLTKLIVKIRNLSLIQFVRLLTQTIKQRE